MLDRQRARTTPRVAPASAPPSPPTGPEAWPSGATPPHRAPPGTCGVLTSVSPGRRWCDPPAPATRASTCAEQGRRRIQCRAKVVPLLRLGRRQLAGEAWALPAEKEFGWSGGLRIAAPAPAPLVRADRAARWHAQVAGRADARGCEPSAATTTKTKPRHSRISTASKILVRASSTSACCGFKFETNGQQKRGQQEIYKT